MKIPLRILLLEDNLRDAELIRTHLESDGIECSPVVVQQRADFIAELDRGVDLVLSDFTLPSFNGMSALDLVRAQQPDLPFIFVSGTMGEEVAVEALKGGATDYILKERLARLGAAVRRAMNESLQKKERQRLQEQLLEAQKVQLLGQLASGIAHDFNNILAVIIGYSDLLVSAMKEEDPLRAQAQEILRAANRAAGLTRQMLLFSRKQTVEPVVLDLNEVTVGMEKMLRRLIGENVELVTQLATDLGGIKGDAGYLGQLLMNLVINARDAMPAGGKVTVETRLVTRNAASDGLPHGKYVVLSVSDTGTGMTDQVKAHLFEPFFTTKPPGKGTGLGLSTSRSIVQQLGGHIEVSSALGKGSRFEVYFPQTRGPVEGSPVVESRRALPRGSETVLLVEDEPSVRHLACTILENLGYNVLRANDGQDGLRVINEHRGVPLRLIITDVVMPKMNGTIMVEWIKAGYPDIKVLFTSGYTEEMIGRDQSAEPGTAFLAKPYTPEALTRKIRALLGTD